MKHVKTYENWNDFHEYKSNNPKNPQLVYERNPEPNIDKLIYDLEPGSNVLDLGCGDGIDTLYFQSNGFNVSGLDASEFVIDENKTKNPNIDWKIYDIADANLPFEDNSLDLIYCRLSLHYFDRFQLSQILHNINLKLKQGAILYLSAKTQSFKDRVSTGKKQLHIREWQKILSYYFKDIHIQKNSGKLYNIPSEWLEIECHKS